MQPVRNRLSVSLSDRLENETGLGDARRERGDGSSSLRTEAGEMGVSGLEVLLVLLGLLSLGLDLIEEGVGRGGGRDGGGRGLSAGEEGGHGDD